MQTALSSIPSEHYLAEIAQDIRQQSDTGYEALDFDRLLKIAPLSRRQIERLFRDHYLTSPARYFRDCQWECARRLLLEGQDVLSASLRAGFASPGRLHDAVVARSGLTPGEMRRRGEGVQIDFGFFQTPIGVVLLAATARGLTALRICGATPDAECLAAEVSTLSELFQNAHMAENTDALQPYADQLVLYLEARTGADFCPTLDIMLGTTFQREVWAEMQRLPPGHTISYGELAARVGKPNAVDEVRKAVDANRLAIAIPCHRCVKPDGSLEDFGWGVAWKERLLQLEAERTSEVALMCASVQAATNRL